MIFGNAKCGVVVERTLWAKNQSQRQPMVGRGARRWSQAEKTAGKICNLNPGCQSSRDEKRQEMWIYALKTQESEWMRHNLKTQANTSEPQEWWYKNARVPVTYMLFKHQVSLVCERRVSVRPRQAAKKQSGPGLRWETRWSRRKMAEGSCRRNSR